MKTLLQDEQGRLSTARSVLWLWTVGFLVLVFKYHPLDAATLASLTNVELALIACIGGPRIAQYLLPQLGLVSAALTKSKRDPENGWEPTHE